MTLSNRKEIEKKLTNKQIRFCLEYIFDWNAARAARDAGYKEKTAKITGYENLTKPYLLEYIELIKHDYEINLNLSKSMVIQEHMKLAFTSIAHFHKTWMDRKDFDDLTPEQKACIQKIKTEKTGIKESVYIELYDKGKALESIAKLMGYNEADKHQHSGDLQIGAIPELSEQEIESTVEKLNGLY